METRRNSTIAPGIKVRDMQTSLDFYTKTLGFLTIDKLATKKGIVFHASVGMDSPALMLSPMNGGLHLRGAKEASETKVGLGVNFRFAMTGTRELDEYFNEIRVKGITIIHEPRTESWGDREFTIEDPDGYQLTFTEHVQDVSSVARVYAYEIANRKKERV